MRRMTGPFVLAAFIGWMALGGTASGAELTWWFHWATQDTKKVVLEEARLKGR